MRQYQPVFPNSLHEFKVNVGGGLVIVFQLDLFERWIIHIRLVLGGGKSDDLFSEIVGLTNEFWIDNHFEDDDSEDFEYFHKTIKHMANWKISLTSIIE